MNKPLISLVVSLLLGGASALAISGAQAQPSPPPPGARMQQICRDLYARQTGALAYLETRLDLTAAQRPLFQRWKDVKLKIAQRRADDCAKIAPALAARNNAGPAERPSPSDRMARQETMLKQRLADLQAERPVLEGLYNALSPEQKTTLANAAGQRGAMMRRAGFRHGMDRRGGRGMGSGFMGRGPMGPGPMMPGPGPGPVAQPPDR